MKIDEQNLKFLKNIRLEQVCVGLYSIILKFSKNVTITIGSKILFEKSNSQTSIWNSEKGKSDFSISSALEEKIINYSLQENRNLKITFSNKDELIIHCEDHFESYIISTPKGHYVFGQE